VLDGEGFGAALYARNLDCAISNLSEEPERC
jgi:hypothetical protein